MRSVSPNYPFGDDSWFTAGSLRDFKANISSWRQQNPVLSSELRLNRLPWAKEWNEELSPFCALAECLNIADSCQVRLAPRHAKAFDLFIRRDREISVQMTIADLDWGLERNPGKVVRWEFERLGKNKIVFGGGGTRKQGGEVMSEPRIISPDDRLAACERGMLRALVKKLEKTPKADWLGIYCRNFINQLWDGGEERLEQSLCRVSGTCPEFERIFIFDTVDRYQFLKSWSRDNSKPLPNA
jgi:hypothetical protein